MGRRISKTVGSGTQTQYLYDGANAVQEAVGSTVNPILVGLNVDERFARNDTTGRTYFLTDALNSTIALTDSSGAIQNQYSYDPYGNASQSGTGFTNPYQYSGREADTAGLYYYRARYYSPGMGSFISEDPARFYGGQLSFYAYVGGDPVDYIDPLGLDLTPAQQAAVMSAAKDWANSKVPYLWGANTKKGADCSGSVSSIYDQAGINIGRLQSQRFKQSPFQPVPAGSPLEPGDVGVYPNHVDLYAGSDNTGVTGDNVFSAFGAQSSHPSFGPANSSWFGSPVWYRYSP